MKALLAWTVISLVVLPTAHAQSGQTCADAISPPAGNVTTVDTTTSTNWITSFGPLVSPSNDLMYTITIGPGVFGAITPLSTDYMFAMYLLDSCAAGTGPVPIAATGTIGAGIPIDDLPEGVQYWIAVTGAAAGGPGANGTVTVSWATTPVTLQSFDVD